MEKIKGIFVLGYEQDGNFIIYKIHNTQEAETFTKYSKALIVSRIQNTFSPLKNSAEWCVYRRLEDGRIEKVYL
ncbi:MAG: hypothetical protein NT129_02430 [Candidatus Aenigmarchaeota archaeon]|nr:hypothetical protein [Candidatus Aenigmarchaeota archaeon]